MRVVALRGESTPALVVDAAHSEPFAFRLARGASATLALDDDVQLELQGPAHVALLEDGEPSLLLREGLVAVDVAAQGVRARRSVFTLATQAALLEVPFAARFVLRAPPQGGQELAVVSGVVELPRDVLPAGAGEPPPSDDAIAFGPTRHVCLPGPRELAGSFSTLEVALTSLSRARACRSAVPSLELLTSVLSQRVDALAALRTHEAQLLAEHGVALEARDQATATQLRAQLGLDARQVLCEKKHVRALRMRLSAAQLGVAPAQAALLLRAKTLENPAP